MNYTAEEVAKLLANRPNQPHYIAWLVSQCVAAEREACASISPNGMNIPASALPHQVWEKYRDAIRARNVRANRIAPQQEQ